MTFLVLWLKPIAIIYTLADSRLLHPSLRCGMMAVGDLPIYYLINASIIYKTRLDLGSGSVERKCQEGLCPKAYGGVHAA